MSPIKKQDVLWLLLFAWAVGMIPSTNAQTVGTVNHAALALLPEQWLDETKKVEPQSNSKLYINGRFVGEKYVVTDTEAATQSKSDHEVFNFRDIDTLYITHQPLSNVRYGATNQKGVIEVIPGSKTGLSFVQVIRSGKGEKYKLITPKTPKSHIHNKYGYYQRNVNYTPGYRGSLPSGVHLNINSNDPKPYRMKFMFNLDHSTSIKMDLLDDQGRFIEPIKEETFEPGKHTIIWNGASKRKGRYLITTQIGGHLRVHPVYIRNKYVGPFAK